MHSKKFSETQCSKNCITSSHVCDINHIAILLILTHKFRNDMGLSAPYLMMIAIIATCTLYMQKYYMQIVAKIKVEQLRWKHSTCRQISTSSTQTGNCKTSSEMNTPQFYCVVWVQDWLASLEFQFNKIAYLLCSLAVRSCSCCRAVVQIIDSTL